LARYFDLLWGFGEKGVVNDASEAPDCLSTSPVAIVAIWRYRFPVTFSRDKQASFSKNPADSTRLRDDVLVIVEDLLSLSISESKSNHVSQLSATLLPGTNYLTETFPGDWVAAWIVNDVATANSLISRVRKGEACNGFNDGLKFLGRTAGGPRVRLTQSPTGLKTSGYTLNAAGFTEFDASIYFEPYLASDSVGAATEWLKKTGEALNNLILGGTDNQQDPMVTTGRVLPFFINAFYGEGVPASQGYQSTPGVSTTKGLDNPNAFVIPDPIGSLLGVTTGTKSTGQKGWNDICNILTGVQRYQLSNDNVAFLNSSNADNSVTYNSAGQIFTPDGLPVDGTSRQLVCPDELLGSFLPNPPQFDGQQTVWSILQQYVNSAVNEMYTCLRVGPTGAIMPTLVVRQLPFTSGVLDETYTPAKTPSAMTPTKKDDPKTQAQNNPIDNPRRLALTRFGELPCWAVPPTLVVGADLGRSDSVRFNFVHVYGETGLPTQNRSEYIVRDPPISDDLDIIRSGFRPYMMTVACSPNDATNRKAGDWMYIVADFVMGQHLTLSGSMELVGIQSPICIGDNISFDNHFFHIEGVTHTFSHNPSGGVNTFRTQLALSHGIKQEQLTGDDFSMYTGTSQEDLQTYMGSRSREYQVNKNEPSSPPIKGVEVTPPVQHAGAAEAEIDPNALGESVGNIAAQYRSGVKN